jgi:hypothetical protein
MTHSKTLPGDTSGKPQARDTQRSYSSNKTGTAEHPELADGSQCQRRSGRLTAKVPILLIGTDGEGRVFTEESHTVIVSQYGAGVVSRQNLVAEQELVLRARGLGREAEIRVVGEIGQQGSLHTYGVAFIKEHGNFWKMEFPPAAAHGAWTRRMILKCGGCGDLAELVNGDFEYDICAIHGGLARFCDACGLLTVWKVSADLIEDTSTAKKKKIDPHPVKEPNKKKDVIDETIEKILAVTGERSSERRTRGRAKVNFFANVWTEGFGEDIVTCIDMSKGGVSFRSKNKYDKDMAVLIAVPFSREVKEAPAIFVKGRIANVRESDREGMWRCGVEFLRE